jgi:hypothetical protein
MNRILQEWIELQEANVMKLLFAVIVPESN